MVWLRDSVAMVASPAKPQKGRVPGAVAQPGRRSLAGQEPTGGAWGAEAHSAEARPTARRAEGGLRPGRGAPCAARVPAT